MKTEIKVRIILVIEAVLLLLGYIVCALAIFFPGFLEETLAELFTSVSDTKGLTVITETGESASDREKEIYILDSASFTSKVFIGILILYCIVMTLLFTTLCIGVRMKATGKLCFWLSIHSVFVCICTLFIVGSVTGEPGLFVYQIPNILFQTYRIGTLLVIYGLKDAISNMAHSSTTSHA